MIHDKWRNTLACLLILALDGSLPHFLFSAESSALTDSQTAGARFFQQGNIEDAISSWTQAIQRYEKAGDSKKQIETLIKRARSYQSIGQYQAALKDLETALPLARKYGDAQQQSSVLASLGDLHIVIGPASTANRYLQEALTIAKNTTNTEMLAVIYNTLGNFFTSQTKYSDALAAYKESAARAGESSNGLLAATALTNGAFVSIKSAQYKDSRALLDLALERIKSVEPSHETIYGLINIGLAYAALRSQQTDLNNILLLKAFEVLNQAASMAISIQDRRAASYAWGYLGSLYESERRYQEALELTDRAIFAAQYVNAPESLYKWQWQAGRVLNALGRSEDALLSYRRAVSTVQSIRPELLITYADPQVSFRDTIGPLYFQLVDLLLRDAATVQEKEAIKAYLVEAREVVELFKVAELRDYFRDDCVDTVLSKLTSLDVISETAAIIYPILLPDRIELLVTLPTGLKRYSVPVGAAQITEEIRQFRRRLEKRTTREYLPYAQRLYNWLVRPLEADLGSSKINTLVFVPDGALRTVPVGALHDGKQFLVAKYALATTPGLNMTDPHPINREKTNVLAVGVTEAVQGFPPLPYVSDELEAIHKLFGSTTLINEEFQIPNLQEKLRNEKVTILHVASHGEFNRDVDRTFLLTFKDKLTMDRLDQMIGMFRFRDEPLELLTLSACDTAAGDDRAALGLAGVAIKAGARSAIASLWTVNDEASADLVAELYREIKDPSISRAVALQRAQLKILSDPRYDHPGFWSAFILINNWL
ncbi:MAG: CHAT domain-containing protein [Deltaproteobacteria bacterium]